MDINVDNYEQFAMDYVEGLLNDAERNAMDTFLINHPEIQAELDGLEKIILPPETIRYERKELLKKKREPIIAIPAAWYKMGAAAAIGGVMVLLGYNVVNSSPNQPDLSASETQTTIVQQDSNPTLPTEEKEMQAAVVKEAPVVVKKAAVSANNKTTTAIETIQETAPAPNSLMKRTVEQSVNAAETLTASSPTKEVVTVQEAIDISMPEIPAPSYADATLIAEAKTTPKKEKITIRQFDLNQNLGITDDSSEATYTAEPRNAENDGFAVETFTANQKAGKIEIEDNKVENSFGTSTLQPSQTLFGSNALGLEISTKKVLKPIKKKKEKN